MASTSRWKCLFRPSVSAATHGFSNVSSRAPQATAFSTTTSMTYPPKPASGAKKTVVKGPHKAAKTLKIKKKAFVKTGRPPNPGERKAMRKRIVLSNTNALEVGGMHDMSPELLLDPLHVGKVLGIPGPVVDQLRAVEAFKTTQGWGLFRRPGMLVREETLEIAKIMKAAQVSKTTSVHILDGERSTGKSMLLLQAMATAFLNQWIVVNVPEGQQLTSACTDYAPIPGTKPVQYSQNTYAANWLSQILKANDAILSTLKLTAKHDLPIPIPEDITLSRLAEIGSKDAEVAWPIFQALWAEITSSGRPPVLLAIDGLTHIMKPSLYRDPSFEYIHSHDLATVKFLVDYISGAKKLTNGGSILAATSKGNTPSSYATELSLKQKREELAKAEITQIDPYRSLDQRSYDSLKHAQLLTLKGLSKAEARGLMEYWAASGVLRQRVDERTVAEKWAVAGNGVIGELQRNSLWMRI